MKLKTYLLATTSRFAYTGSLVQGPEETVS